MPKRPRQTKARRRTFDALARDRRITTLYVEKIIDLQGLVAMKRSKLKAFTKGFWEKIKGNKK